MCLYDVLNVLLCLCVCVCELLFDFVRLYYVVLLIVLRVANNYIHRCMISYDFRMVESDVLNVLFWLVVWSVGFVWFRAMVLRCSYDVLMRCFMFCVILWCRMIFKWLCMMVLLRSCVCVRLSMFAVRLRAIVLCCYYDVLIGVVWTFERLLYDVLNVCLCLCVRLCMSLNDFVWLSYVNIMMFLRVSYDCVWLYMISNDVHMIVYDVLNVFLSVFVWCCAIVLCCSSVVILCVLWLCNKICAIVSVF